MRQTQISLREDQAVRLSRLAKERHTSMAALIRAAVDRAYPDDEGASLESRFARALTASGCARSGVGDVAERHDEYLVAQLESH